MKKSEQQTRYDRGQVFVKIIAAVLAVLMILAVGATLLAALF